jgi:hypothetical protein
MLALKRELRLSGQSSGGLPWAVAERLRAWPFERLSSAALRPACRLISFMYYVLHRVLTVARDAMAANRETIQERLGLQHAVRFDGDRVIRSWWFDLGSSSVSVN